MNNKGFSTGQLVATRRVCEMADKDDDFSDFIRSSFARYITVDWGDTCDEDKKLNDDAVKNGERILAVYRYSDKTSVWIITERDRSVTTILFPDEY